VTKLAGGRISTTGASQCTDSFLKKGKKEKFQNQKNLCEAWNKKYSSTTVQYQNSWGQLILML